MKTLNKLFIATIVVISTTACNNELSEQLASNNGGDVKFTMGIEGTSASRVVMEDDSYQASFEKENKVGVFVKGVESYSNMEYTFDGNVWNGPSVKVPVDGVYTYYAYYPYTESAATTSVPVEVNLDQETNGYLANDFLMSNLTAEAGQANVNLQFTHALSLVEVTLSGTNATEDALVTLSDVVTDATINLELDSVTLGTKKADVIMDKLTTSMKYRAIVPQQIVSKGTPLMTIVSKGRTYKVTYKASDVKFEKGKYISLNVELGSSSSPEDVTVTITSQGITDWGEGSAVDGSATVEEEVAKIISPIGNELTAITTNDRNSDLLAESIWFKLIRGASDPASAEVVDASENTIWKKAAKLSYTSKWSAGKAVNNSYYIATIGYFYNSPILTDSSNKYKLTFKAKVSLLEKVGESEATASAEKGKVVVTCRNAANNASFAAVAVPDFENVKANTVTYTVNTNDEWDTYTTYFDFSNKNTSVGSVAEWIPTTSDDYKKIDVRFYTNNPTKEGKELTSTIYISDVELVPYKE